MLIISRVGDADFVSSLRSPGRPANGRAVRPCHEVTWVPYPGVLRPWAAHAARHTVRAVETTARIQAIATWLGQHAADVVLAVTVSGLAVGGGLYLAGERDPASLAWLAVTACGLAYALWTLVDSVRKRAGGADLIALLALAGAIAVGELLAGAVISVMLASGRALEGWAAGRARRDLTGLLARAPRTARRY